MRNTIKTILTSLKGLKVSTIAKSYKTLTGVIFIALIAINYAFYLNVTLKENKEVIFYSQEKKETRKNVEFLDSEIKELYEELAKEINYDDCLNNQLIRLLANKAVDMEYCELIEEEMDEEDKAFTDEIMKELLGDEY